jgi:mannose-1-phosphate guanylyltransferase
MIHVILLSGGSGTRLWPLSNSARSKQFLKVLRDAEGRHVSMVQRVFGQIDAVDADVDITIATSASQVDALAMQVGGRYALSVEPERRDTAPAIMLACAHLDLEQHAGMDDPVIVMPIDTYAEQGYYDRIPRIAETIASGASDLVLLGVEPTYPSEKYGYIIPASTEGEAWPVETFREKPDEATARDYIERGGLWNCGVFGFRLGWLRDLTRSYADAPSFAAYVERYRELPRNSFDYEVVEKAESIRVVPYAGTWKDLGTWNTLTEEMAESSSGHVWLDAATTKGVHAVNETGLPMVIAGIQDAVVVATPDGILVSGKEESAHIKGLVEEASYARPMYERRQWGEYRVMDEQEYADGTHTLTKELVLNPGRQLSYQRHAHRSEIWTIASGTGEVVLDDEVVPVAVGDCVRIAPGQMHGARAITQLHIVEVQVGWPLVEEDIERFGFFWELEGYDA